MATLVNKPQAIRAGVKNPMPGYSRIVECGGLIAGAGGYTTFYTAPFGSKFWLLDVTIRFGFGAAVNDKQVTFELYHGFGEPATHTAMRIWKSLFSFRGRSGEIYYELRDETRTFEWSMSQRLDNVGDRFGVVVFSNSLVIGQLLASFEISEG